MGKNREGTTKCPKDTKKKKRRERENCSRRFSGAVETDSGFVVGTMSTAPLQVSRDVARRFHRRAVLLDAPVASVGAALAHHGYVQIDPLNICGRMQEHILRNRVVGYREGDLLRHLHGHGAALPAERRTAFEHHLPDSSVLVALPNEAWPHLAGAMRARMRRTGAWSGRLTPRERELAARILAELEGRGALSSEQIEDNGRRGAQVWGKASLAKATLQKLFFHGRVLIARRENNRRYYDLPERVLPAAVRAIPEAATADTARWLVELKLRQRRLVTLKRGELPLVEDLVQRVTVEGCPPLYCLREDLRWFDQAEEGVAAADVPRGAESSRTLHLLAPLDPLIYDRRITTQLWNFDYTWEVYTPAAKRVRGYYALPVLAGTEIVGHVDPKADREAGRLRVMARRVRRGYRVATAVEDLAGFLGLRA
jgi:uncharacterized protein YcaQ